jgi:hypothetical protein
MIPQFPDENHVRITPEHRPETVSKGRILLDLVLNNPIDFVFNRVLDGANIFFSDINTRQRAIKRRGFARASGADNENQTAGAVQDFFDQCISGIPERQPPEKGRKAMWIQRTANRAIAVNTALNFNPQPDITVLVRDIEATSTSGKRSRFEKRTFAKDKKRFEKSVTVGQG